MFRVHETTVFTNATGPPKVVKLSQKAALLDLTWPRKIDLAGVWVVKGGGKGGGKGGMQGGVQGGVQGGCKSSPKLRPFATHGMPDLWLVGVSH